MPEIIPKLVSIALATYNGERFLSQQLDTLLSQTYKNIEIIACDDNSTDNTWLILQEYAEKNKLIKIFRNEGNLGFIKNFERAVKLCEGDFIAISDQDDLWQPEKIEKLTNAINNYSLIYSDSAFIDANNAFSGEKMGDTYSFVEGFDGRNFTLTNCVSGHASMFRRDLVPYILPFPACVDYDWWAAFVATTQNGLKYFDECLVSYRQHAESVTDNSGLSKDTTKNTKQYKENIKLKIEKDRIDRLHLFEKTINNNQNNNNQNDSQNDNNKKTQLFCAKLGLLFTNRQHFFTKIKLVFVLLTHVNVVYKLRKKSFFSKIWRALQEAFS